jgi:hypothetical protein
VKNKLNLLIFVLLFVFWGIGTNAVHAQSYDFVVTTTSDIPSSGQLTLREAIAKANTLAASNPGAIFHISFQLTQPAVIVVSSTSLPLTAGNTTIDGDMNGDSIADVAIVTDASFERLLIQSSHNTIKNLILSGAAINGPFATDNTFTNNNIGAGFVPFAGSPTFARMGIPGLIIKNSASTNVIENNYVGGSTDNISATSNPSGILLTSGAHDNLIQGNFVGLKRDGTALANDYGIAISPTFFLSLERNHHNIIRNNYIVNSTIAGIIIEGVQSDNNSVVGNNIGIMSNGTIGRNQVGVFIRGGASNNIVGSGGTPLAASCANPCNIIRGNQWGITVQGSNSINNNLRGNIIYGNTELGIDLLTDQGSAGVTSNDKNDTDSGPNNLINAPVRLKFKSNPLNPTQIIIDGVITPPILGSTWVDVYGSTAEVNPYGALQGDVYLGTVEVKPNPDPSKVGKFELTVTDDQKFKYLTAVATDENGSTSEYSAYDVWIRAVEVTQVVQDLDNTVPLIAEKDTMVRVHVFTNGETPDVSATLHMFDATTKTEILPALESKDFGQKTQTIGTRPNRNYIFLRNI